MVDHTHSSVTHHLASPLDHVSDPDHKICTPGKQLMLVGLHYWPDVCDTVPAPRKHSANIELVSGPPPASVRLLIYAVQFSSNDISTSIWRSDRAWWRHVQLPWTHNNCDRSKRGDSYVSRQFPASNNEKTISNVTWLKIDISKISPS